VTARLTERTASRALERTVVAAPPIAISEAAIRAAVAEAVREELRAQTRTGARPATVTPAEPAIREARIAPESVEALESSRVLVSGAIAAHRWGPEEAAELRGQLGLLTELQRDEILHTLMPAINRGELQVSTTGALF
jgi:hypothetical protein